MDSIMIQARDTSGNWRTYLIVMGDSQRVVSEMRSLQRQYPDYRIRAVNSGGRVVDIL
jgi:hypothetical protein